MKKFLVLIISVTLLVLFIRYQQEAMDRVFVLLGKAKSTHPFGKKVALVSDHSKSVTLKRSDDTVWNTVDINEDLAILDSLSTGYDSSATLKFDLGYMISLGERSLIVIEDPKKESANLIEIKLDQGTIEAKNTDSSNTTLKISTANTVTEVKGKTEITMSVNKKTKKAAVWVTVGTAKVQDKKTGEEIAVKQNESKNFSIEDIKEKVVKAEELPKPEVKPAEVIAAPVVEEEEARVAAAALEEETTKAPELATVAPEPEQEPVIAAKKTPPKKNDISKNVARQRKNVNTCYERNRHATGGKRISVRFFVANTGAVTRADIIKSDLGNSTVESCVLFWIKALKFPKFDGNEIEQTINFVFQ